MYTTIIPVTFDENIGGEKKCISVVLPLIVSEMMWQTVPADFEVCTGHCSN